MVKSAFTGSRLKFMESQLDGYTQALATSTAANFRAVLLRRYFKRYPINMPHEEEPTPEALAIVDDDEEMDDEDISGLTAEEIAIRAKTIKKRRDVSLYRS